MLKSFGITLFLKRGTKCHPCQNFQKEILKINFKNLRGKTPQKTVPFNLDQLQKL